MATSTQWQLARESAERYQTILTPAILGPFARALVDFAALQTNETILDVGCGTGAAARYAAEIVGGSGHVIGLDVNASMLEVARSLPAVQGAAVEWREASTSQLPLTDQSVDVALCAQTLQFLPEKQLALSEMRRVIKSGGRVAVSLWCDIENNPYFSTLVESITRHIGTETAAGLQSAFALSNASDIHGLFKTAGFSQVKTTVTELGLPLPPLAEFVPRHISATPMAAGFSRAAHPVQQTIIREVAEKLNQYRKNGRPQIPFRSHMILGKNEAEVSTHPE